MQRLPAWVGFAASIVTTASVALSPSLRAVLRIYTSFPSCTPRLIPGCTASCMTAEEYIDNLLFVKPTLEPLPRRAMADRLFTMHCPLRVQQNLFDFRASISLEGDFTSLWGCVDFASSQTSASS